VMQYADEYYLVTHLRYRDLHGDDARRARALASWKKRVESAWRHVQVRPVALDSRDVELGHDITITAEVLMDALMPDDVSVQLLTGRVDGRGELQERTLLPMICQEKRAPGVYLFHASWRPAKSGLCGYAIRVLPRNQDAVGPFWPSLITWAGDIPASRPEPVVT